MGICRTFLFHGFGKIKKEVMVKGYGDAHQHVCVDVRARENLVNIPAVAVESGCKPCGRATFGLAVENLFYQSAHMHSSLAVDLSVSAT